MRPTLVVCTCGKIEAPGPSQAQHFYRGGFVQAQYATAKALRPSLGWAILSSRYGLMPPTHVLADAYDSRWGYVGEILESELAGQAAEWPIPSRCLVVCLGGKDYALKVKGMYPQAKVVWPAACLKSKGIGFRLQQLQVMCEVGAVSPHCLENCEI